MPKLRMIFALIPLLIPLTTVAQDWPSRALKFVVPYPPGGSTDIAARVLGEYLSQSFGQQVIVENKSGAGGVIGVEAGAKGPPDGYTVLIAPDFIASAPHVFKMSIDPIKDLEPVVQLSRQPVVLGSPRAWREVVGRIGCAG